MILDHDRPARLIVSRRAISAALGALVASPAASVPALAALSDVPASFNPADYATMTRDGLFLPDYRHPMVRLLFDDGGATGWHTYLPSHTRKRGVNYNGHVPVRDTKAVAIECCAPDANGMPRFTQLAIG